MDVWCRAHSEKLPLLANLRCAALLANPKPRLHLTNEATAPSLGSADEILRRWAIADIVSADRELKINLYTRNWLDTVRSRSANSASRSLAEAISVELLIVSGVV